MTHPGATEEGVEDRPSGSPRTLLAVLASPPTTAGTRTLNQVRVAAVILDCQHVRVVNLFPVPTRDVPAISASGSDREVWLAGRAEVSAAFRDADAVVAGWGVTAPVGPARGFMREQVAWFTGAAHDAGFPRCGRLGASRGTLRAGTGMWPTGTAGSHLAARLNVWRRCSSRCPWAPSPVRCL